MSQSLSSSVLIMEKQIKKIYSKHIEEEKEENHKSHTIVNFPYEITLDILSRLSITSLIQSRYVCRLWRTLAHDSRLANMCRYRTDQATPYLIFHCDYPIQNKLYFAEFLDPNNSKGIVRQIHTPFSAEMSEFKVIGSCSGLLCLSNSLFNDSIYIYNPFTGYYKELPKSTCFHNEKSLFGFGFDPTKNDYKVVRIAYYLKQYTRKSEVQIYSSCDGTWRSIGAVSGQLEQQGSSEPILVNGALHWASRPSRLLCGRIIVSFDLVNERFYEVAKPDFGGIRSYNFHLAVFGDCLSAVYCDNGKLEIYVMKEYGNKESWISEDIDLGAISSNQDSQDSKERIVRVLGLIRKGEILLEYNGESFASYDPAQNKLRNLMLKGKPKLFKTIVHSGSFNWIDNSLEI